MNRVLVIGGGIVGLSIGYELAQRGFALTIVDKSAFGEKASWAGAGMLPPANAKTSIHPLEKLTSLSNDMHANWSKQLQEQTGIDNGFRQTGSLHLAHTFGEIASLTGLADDWKTLEIPFRQLDSANLKHEFPFLDSKWHAEKVRGLFTPAAAQFDNRKHLEALKLVLKQQNADRLPEHEIISFEQIAFSAEQTVTGVNVAGENDSFHRKADHVVIAAGPWTSQIVESLGAELPMQPVRGQMIGYQLKPNQHSWVASAPTFNDGGRYLVTRACGSVVAGSTIEETGFACHTTESEIRELRNWAESILPCLNDDNFCSSWAGLRPATFDGFPYLGRLQGFSNVWIAAGHFKAGLQLSTGTANVIADLIQQKTPQIDLTPFAPARVTK